MTSEKKERRFKDILQVGEGGSSSNQKYEMILISDIFRKGGGSQAFVKTLILVYTVETISDKFVVFCSVAATLQNTTNL